MKIKRKLFEMKAQSTAEYMVIISMVIAYSIILIYTMIQYLSTGVDANISDSQAYWGGRYPLAIKYSTLYSNGTLNIIIENKGLRGLTFYNISLDNETIHQETEVPINSEFTVSGDIGTCQEGDIIQYEKVTIMYKINGVNQTLRESGDKAFIVVCTS